MRVTLAGMTMDTKEVQPLNAMSPMVVTLSGMVMEVMLAVTMVLVMELPMNPSAMTVTGLPSIVERRRTSPPGPE